MSLDIDISHNLDAINDLLSKKTTKHAVRAAKRGIKRAATAIKTEGIKRIREKRNIKVSLLRQRFVSQGKVFGNTLDTVRGEVTFSGKSIGLINFVQGRKEPRPQKGIAVRKRRPVRVQVKRGKRTKLKRAFIAKGRNNKYQVFVRQGKRRLPLTRKAVNSVSSMVRRPRLRAQLNKRGRDMFQREFIRTFRGLMDGSISQANRRRLKKAK